MFLDSVESPLSQDSIQIYLEDIGCRSWPRKGVQESKAARVKLLSHVRPPTSEGHNFFIQIPIRVFLHSMEIPLSQASIQMSLEGIGAGSGLEGAFIQVR